MQQGFQTKYFVRGALNIIEYYYIFSSISTKEVWDTLKKTYKVPTKMARENTFFQEIETPSESENNL